MKYFLGHCISSVSSVI
uniref:Uncharacterized protein n=1 Tax=Anguilla anguilla TaxID=7936 RepID=A0A0E9TYM1_ANGAN